MSNYKSPIRIINSDFRNGELDPLLAMRGDITVLPEAGQKLTNMLVSQLGPVSRRPGTRMMAKLPAASRLLEFEFDANERYVIALTNAALTIYRDDNAGNLVFVETIGGAPWTSATLFEVNVMQKLDVMILVHPSFQMRRLRREGLSDFALTVLNFGTDTSNLVYNQPVFKFAPRTDRIRVTSVEIGVAQLIAEQPTFTADWVGLRVRIFNCEILITAVTNSTTADCSVRQRIRKELGIAPLRAQKAWGPAGGNFVEITHALHGLSTGASVEIYGAADVCGITGDEINGVRVITVVDEDHYWVSSSGEATESGDGGGPSVLISTTDFTRDWTEQLWSNMRGWPGAIALHENRLWLAGSTDAPTYISASAVGDYYDHNVRDGLDDESIQGQISALSRIIHLVSSRNLQIFSETSEAVTSSQPGEPITPGTLKVVTHTHYGASHVRPMLFDGATLFTQRNGKNIRELVYDYNTDAQVSAPVSLRSNHLITAPIDLAVIDGTPLRPEQFAFIVNSDGSVAVLQSLRLEKLAAWTPLQLGGGGLVRSACVVGSSAYFAVQRGSDFFLEKFELDTTDIWLDFARRMSGAPSATWALGADYAGRTLDVMCRNNYLGQVTADGSGTIVVSMAVPEIIAGHAYPVVVVPNPPDKEMTDGSMTGEIRRVLSATIHFHKSSSATVNGHEQLHINPLSDPANQPALTSAKKRVRLLGYGRDPTFTISQSTPGPLTVLGLSMEVSL